MRSSLVARVLIVVLLATVLLWGGAAPPRAATTEAAADSTVKTITVTGSGNVTLPPDMATAQLGVETTARTAKEAMDKNALAMNMVVDTIRALGIDDKDIQTTGINLYPYRLPRPLLQPGGETPPATDQPAAPAPAPVEPPNAAPGAMPVPVPVIQGYRATNNVRVTIRNLANVAAVVDGAVASGATLVSGVSFGLTDASGAQDTALSAAAAAAKSRADVLARALGLTITGVQSVSEGGSGGPFPVARAAPAAGVSTPIEPGQLTVTASVTVAFIIQ